MSAIPNSDIIDRKLSTSAEDAKSRVRAIDTTGSNPLKKIGSSDEMYRGVKIVTPGQSFTTGGNSQEGNRDEVFRGVRIITPESSPPPQELPAAAQPTTAQATPVAAQAAPVAAQPERPIKETGFLENILDIGTAISEGGQQTLNRLGATGGVATNNPRVVVESAKYAQDIEARSEAERLRQLKKDFEALRKIERKDTDLIDDVFFYAGKVGKLVLENPTGTAQFVAEQIPNMATAMAPAFALGKVGAIGGTAVFPGIGTTIGGVGGFLVGLFGGNALLEIGGKAQEKAADGTFTDKERSESASEGAIKAGVITAVDAATLGTSRWIYGAGSRAVEKATTKTLEKLNVNPAVATANVEKAIKEAVDSAKAANLPAAQARTTVSEAAQKAARDSGLLDPAVIKAVKQAQDQAYKSVNKLHKRLGRNATPIALETLGEGVGEYLGELAATGEASVLDAVIESLAGAAQSSVELATIVAPSGADGKATNVTRNAILTEEARIRKEEEEAGRTRAEEDAKRTSDVRSLVANAIDVKKALATSNGVNMLAALHDNYAADGDVTSLIAKAAKDAGQELAFNTAKASTESINAGKQMISDSPAFAEEFLQAVRNFASNDAAVDTTPADSLFDEDIAAQERAGTLLRQRPTPTPPQDTQQAPPSVPPGEPPAKTQTAKAVENLRNIWDDVAGPPVGAIGPGNLVNPQRQRKYTAADLPPAIFKVMQALVADGYKTFKDIADQVIRRMRLSDSWRDLESQVTQEMLRSAYNQLPQFDGKERFPTSESITGVVLTGTSPYLAKDQRKADRATKFIGRGSPRSSTAQYAKDFGAIANSGTYYADDVVFISAEGNRADRMQPDFAEIQEAMSAGATILTDDADNRNRSYNVGERQVADYLSRNGYAETAPGEWTPAQNSATTTTSPKAGTERPMKAGDRFGAEPPDGSKTKTNVDAYSLVEISPKEEAFRLGAFFTNKHEVKFENTENGKQYSATLFQSGSGSTLNRTWLTGIRSLPDNTLVSDKGFLVTRKFDDSEQSTVGDDPTVTEEIASEAEQQTTQQNNLEDDFRFGQKDAGERTPSDMLRDRGYSTAVSDENFPSDRFDKTVDRARDGSAEALQVATDFVGASEKVAASKKKLADLKKSKANRVEIERATQEVERDTQAYNAAAEKLDRPAPKKLPASSQQRGIKDVSNREQSISRLRSAYVEAKKKVLELLKNGKIWEAREPWENLSTDIRKLNSQLQALRYESNSLKNEIATNADDGEQTQALRSEKREVDKRIRELEEEIFLAKRRFFDFAKEFYESKPSLPLAKLILEEISAIQNQFINSASDSKNNRGFERKPFPRTYLQALEQHTPFFLTIRSIIVDIYNSGETDINKAVRTRLGNWSYWVNAASKDQQENSAVANYKPFTDKQIAHMVEKMKSFASPANVAASFHSYKNAVDGDYSTKDGEVFRKRLERIVEKLSDSTFYKYLSNSAYKQLAVIDRIIDGTATPEEVASYGHFGGSISQDRSTYMEVASTASKDAAEIRKEIMDGLKSFKERLSKNAEKDSNIIDGIQNKWDIEDAWNTARDQVFFEMQAEYRRAIDAGLNANEVSNIFNEAMRNMAMVYAYKPSFAMDYSSKVGTYDPVLQQLFGDRSESMFPERNGTTADMDAGVRDATVEAIKSSEPLSSTQIVYDLVNDLKSGKITLSNAVQSVTDALRDKEVKLSDIIATLKAAKVERPSYIATITSHISLRYSLDYWVSKNGGGKEYVDQWLADHHSLNVIQSFKDIFVMNKDGEPVVQKDLLELEGDEKEAYKLWLSEKRRQSEASGAEIMADLEESADVLKNFAFAKYSINNLPQDGNAVDLINAWHRDIEYAIRKYPHLREQIISNDGQSADAYVVGADARAHKAWVESIVASVKESYASGSKKAKAVLIDLLETNQITEAEYDRFYDKIAIATQSEYQAIIDEAIELSRNYDRRGRNKRVLPRAKEDKGDNTINALRRIKHGDSHKARTLDELEDAESDAADKVVGADFAMNSNPFSIIESMSDDVDAGNAALDEFYDQSLGQEDFDESTLQLPNIRLRQGAYSGVVTAVQTQTWVNDLISGWSAAPKVHVVSRPSMIRDSKTRDRIIAKIGSDSGAKGAFDPEDGSVYIFSDYVTSEDDLEFTLFHEVKGHLGLRGLLGDKFDSFLDSVYRTNNTVREQVDQMTAAGGVTRLEAVEELLSDFNATERTPSAVANFVGAVIRGLRNIGLNRVADWFASVTTAEVQYVLNAAARWAKNGDMSAFNGAPDVIRLSSNPVPFEMFASKKGKLHGYARYDPLTNEWILFTDFVNDIRGGGSKTRRIADIADVKLELQRHGKIEERKRSSYFQSHKTPSSFVTLPNLMEGTALRKYWNQFVQVVQNEYLPVWRLMDHLDRIGRLTGVTDLRTDISLYERKAGSLLDTFTKKYVDEVKYLLEKAYKKGATSEFINLAMIAQHAEERNRAVLFSQLKNIYKGSVTVQGAVPVVDQDNITVQEYRDIYKAVKSLKASGAPEFKAISLNETGSGMGKTQRVKVNGDVIPGYVDVLQSLTNSPARAEIEQIGKLLDKLGDSRVDYMFKTGLVSLEDAANMKKYKNYRNLSGVNTELDDDPTVDSMIDRFGQKFNAAKGKEKRALGRGDIAPDVIARTLTAFQSTIIRGQKNLVAQKVLMVFEHNYDPQFIVINEIAKKQKLGSDGVVRVVDDENYMGRKDVMVARVHGRPVTMRFKQTGKGSVGEALHGMIYPPQQNQFLYWVGRLNRIIGQMLTTWNPLWVPVNAIRDVQTLYSNAAADGRIGRAAAFKMLRTVPAGMRVAVYANVESLVPRTTAGRLAKAAVLAVIGKPSQGIYKSYLEAKYNGGLTTFINHTSLEEQVIALDRIFNGSFTQGGVKGAVTGALDFTIDKVETLGKALEFFTIPFELGPRIAAYHVAKDPMYGKMTKEDAAVFSGEITVNFNMRGSGAPLRQLFLFFNPAVQGTAKMADVAKKNPARFATIAGSWIAFGAMMNLIGRALSGDDENGENKIDGIPIYKRATSAVFAADVPFAAIPIAYGYNALYAVGHFMTDSLVAAVPWSTTTKRIAATTFEAFSPVGMGIADASTPLTAAAKTISPQIVLPLVEYMLNENRFGAPIYMDESFSGEVKPDSQRAFRSVHPMSKFATDKLHQMTGGNKYTTDGIDINPALVDQFVSGYLPGVIDTAYKSLGRYMRQSSGLDVDLGKPDPFAARFTAYRPEMMDAAIFRDASKKVKTIMTEIENTPPESQRFKELVAKYPKVELVHADLTAAQQHIRGLASQINALEKDIEYKRISGTLTKDDEARFIAAQNILRREQIAVYKRTTKSLIQNGFRDTVISRD